MDLLSLHKLTEADRSGMLTILLAAIFVHPAAHAPNVYAMSADVFQTMEFGDPGDTLTSRIINASSRGGYDTAAATWSLYPGTRMWVSTECARQLPGKVFVKGVDCNVPGTRTWRFRNKYENNYAIVNFASNQWGAPYHNRMTIACYFTTFQTSVVSNQHDNIEMSGTQSFGVLQTVDKLYLRAHSCTQPGWNTTFSPEKIPIIPGKTYWVNLHYDGISGKVKVAAFDPIDGWAQVGKTVVAESVPGSTVKSTVNFGNCSPHGNAPDNETSAFFDNIVIDCSNAAFPLVPDNVPVLKHGREKIISINPYAVISPNPFAGTCLIRSYLPSPASAVGKKIRLYDLSGRIADESNVMKKQGIFNSQRSPVKSDR